MSILLDQWYPRSTRTTVDDYFAKATTDVQDLLSAKPGLRVNEVAEILGMNIRMAQVVVGQLMTDGKLIVEGKTRGARYTVV